MTTFKAHPIAELFPLLEGAALDALISDIKEHGQREPIVLFEDRILDGRNRYRACKVAKVEPRTKMFRGTHDAATAFVISTNLHRRHLDESQRAMVAARVATMHQGSRTDLRSNDLRLVSQTEAAGRCNVSVPSLKRAAAVLKTQNGNLIAAVDAGRIPVSVGAKIADEEESIQNSLVAHIEDDGWKPAQALAMIRHDERVEKLASISAGNAPLTSKQQYPIIVADPPWRYEQASTDSRAIENHYPTMDLKEICNLPVNDLATEDAVLFLWTTSPKLEESLRVVEAWGFTYRTCAVWDKEKIGMGYFFRQQHELLLIAIKGQPPHPAPSDRVSSVIRAPRSKHSAKPAESYEIIDAMYPTLPKVELFCRSPRKGWAAWGNQSAE